MTWTEVIAGLAKAAAAAIEAYQQHAAERESARAELEAKAKAAAARMSGAAQPTP